MATSKSSTIFGTGSPARKIVVEDRHIIMDIDHEKDNDPSEVFRDLVVRAALELYCARTVEECSAFGPPSKVIDDPKIINDFGVGRSPHSSTNIQSSSMESSPMISEPTEGSPPAPSTMMMVLDLARLVLGQAFRCYPAADGPGTRTGGCRLPTTGGRKSSTTTPDRGSAGSPPLRAAGKRDGKRRRRRPKRTPKSSSPEEGSRLLPISYRLGLNCEDGTLTAHPFRPGSPQVGAESSKSSTILGSEGPTSISATTLHSSMIWGPGAIKLRPASRSFAEALFHSWTVLYYPASLVLSTDAAAAGGSRIGVDDLDGPTSPHYQRWLESYRFLVDQLGGDDRAVGPGSKSSTISGSRRP